MDLCWCISIISLRPNMPGYRIVGIVLFVLGQILLVRADEREDPLASARQILTEVARGGHRVAMIFPLLLGIAGRLAALVPTFFLGLIGIFTFVALSKKAFIISVIAFLIAYTERRNNHRPKIIHIHHPPHSVAAYDFHNIQEVPPLPHFKPWKYSNGGRREDLLDFDRMFYPSKFPSGGPMGINGTQMFLDEFGPR